MPPPAFCLPFLRQLTKCYSLINGTRETVRTLLQCEFLVGGRESAAMMSADLCDYSRDRFSSEFNGKLFGFV
jgi:hypothetical protein